MTYSPGYQALRRGRVSLAGQVYLLTTTTAGRRHLFSRFAIARTVCQCMADPACWPRCSLLCWVLMPDHWHGMVCLDAEGDISTTMNRWKAIATRRLHRQGLAGQVWAKGFHDHALRYEDDLRHVARYIVANPLRAGLVGDVLDYPYWDCVWYTPQAISQPVVES
ncbi:MAG TPA: transposase [Rhodanobacteraceae bacterium]